MRVRGEKTLAENSICLLTTFKQFTEFAMNKHIVSQTHTKLQY